MHTWPVKGRGHQAPQGRKWRRLRTRPSLWEALPLGGMAPAIPSKSRSDTRPSLWEAWRAARGVLAMIYLCSNVLALAVRRCAMLDHRPHRDEGPSRDARLRQGSEGNRVHYASGDVGQAQTTRPQPKTRCCPTARRRGADLGFFFRLVVNHLGLECVAPGLLEGRSADVLSWVHIMDAFLSDECVSVQCHDHFALAAGELHGVGVLDLPVVEVEPFGSVWVGNS